MFFTPTIFVSIDPDDAAQRLEESPEIYKHWQEDLYRMREDDSQSVYNENSRRRKREKLVKCESCGCYARKSDTDVFREKRVCRDCLCSDCKPSLGQFIYSGESNMESRSFDYNV